VYLYVQATRSSYQEFTKFPGSNFFATGTVTLSVS
jgi:hypothetical protein